MFSVNLATPFSQSVEYVGGNLPQISDVQNSSGCSCKFMGCLISDVVLETQNLYVFMRANSVVYLFARYPSIDGMETAIIEY